MKIDVYGHVKRFNKWKEDVVVEGELGLTRENSDILLQYLFDMEVGRNVSRKSKRGARSYIRLNAARYKLSMLFRFLQERGVADVRASTEEQIVKLFNDLERGVIKTIKGEKYKSVCDYAKTFKAFWHWWMKVNRKQDVIIDDITEEINTAQREQPKFVYLTKENVEALMEYFSPDHQVLLMFSFDSIIRSPTESLSLQVKHVYEKEGEVWITIPDDISKTFGRTFNLLYSGEMLLEYIARNNLQPEDHLFRYSPHVMNRQLKVIATQIFGNNFSHPQGNPYKMLSLYDFRHSGTIHFRLLAKDNPGQISLDAIRHRGGWTDFKMLNYYTRFIGLDGRIEKQGMLLRQDKHKLERELEDLKREFLKIKEMNKGILQAAQAGIVNRQESENLFGVGAAKSVESI